MTLVALEGIDGAGKSTLCRALAAALRSRGERVTVVSRYLLPELTQLWRGLVAADAVDQDGAALIAACDHAAGVARVVEPALARGDVVLADRWLASHHVHFGLRGVPERRRDALFAPRVAVDLVLWLSVPPDVALERLRREGKPDVWEARLDHRPGESIGSAVAAAPARAERERAFLAAAADAERRFAALLTGAVRLDARARPERLAAQAQAHVETVVRRHAA